MYRNLCISGAGTRGPALIGALIELKTQGKLKNIRDMTGVSFGSFIVFLVSIGWDPAELCEATKNINVADMCKPNVRHFFDTFGLAPTSDIIGYIDALVKEKGIDPNITFRDHMYLTDVMIRIPALCLNTRELVYFTHLSHPNLPVREAIRASMSIPLIYTSPVIDGNNYVDGGVIRNTPYDPYIGHEDQTICLTIIGKKQNIETITDIQVYIGALLGSLHKVANYVPDEFCHLIEIHTPYNGMSFSIKQEEIEDMIAIGIQTVHDWVINPSQK